MPDAWVHSSLDLIVYGRPYFDLNKWIDDPSEQLGRRHRGRRHDYYLVYGKRWHMENPFPHWVGELTTRVNRQRGAEEAEKFQVSVSHSYIDRVWDGLSPEERAEREQALAAIALDPDMLKRWAGVDVREGKIQRVLYDGREVWEPEPSLPGEYQRLVRYIRRVLENRRLAPGNSSRLASL